MKAPSITSPKKQIPSSNGKTVWENGQPKQNLRGLNFLESTANYIKFSVDPGTWSFQAELRAIKKTHAATLR
jgi:hypothetical protein